MSINSFDRLSLSDKIKILYQEGAFIMAIRYYGYKVNLYLLEDVYYEVFYNHKRDLIEKINVLERDHSRMKFYQDQIKLPETL